MITSAVFIALIGTFQFKATISAAISYEPIKITVNENFNAQPGQVSTEFQSLEPDVVHQGANFYFKPKFNLPSSSILYHIEALMSLIQQHHSCAKDATKVVIEKDKLMEILKPFLNPKESLSDTVMEEENSSETVKPVSILITEEPKQATPELLVIPEAPVLPPISYNSLSPIVQKEIKNEESVTLEESTGVLNEPTVIEVEPKPTTIELEVIPEDPVLSPFSSNDIRIVEEVKIEEPPMPQPTLVDIEAKPVITELLVMPEGPVLPTLSFNGMSSIVGQEVKKKESLILEQSTDIFPTMPAISVGPIIEPIITYVEPKSSTSSSSGLLVIPEAPVLPSSSFNGMPSFVEKEVKKEESIILEESTDESQEPTTNVVEPKPATPELVLIPEPPVLPPPSANDIHVVEEVKIEGLVSLPMLESIVVDIEPKSVTPELFAIPEATILPPLSFNGIPAFVEEEVKKEESVILEESTGVLQEPTIIEVEPRPATPELVVIPEAPVLPPMSEMAIVEEINSDESILLEESTGSIPEISARPNLESFVETETAETFTLENNIFPVTTDEIKIEIPILLEESIEVFPPIAEISSEPTLQEPEITNSYVLKEVSQPNSNRVAAVKETLPLTIIRKPSNNLGVFSYAPFLSHLSSRASNAKKRMFPKPAALERFLLNKHPFRLPVTPFPKLFLDYMKSPNLRNKNHFPYPTSYAHGVAGKRFASNIGFKNNARPKRVKNYVRSNVPKGPSYL